MILESFSGTAKISIALLLCSVVIVKYQDVVVISLRPRISLSVYKSPQFIKKCEANVCRRSWNLMSFIPALSTKALCHPLFKSV